jgi:hypothetical protein
VFGVAAASRNTRFQPARYGFTWAGLAPADRASFAWRLHSFDHLATKEEFRKHCGTHEPEEGNLDKIRNKATRLTVYL